MSASISNPTEKVSKSTPRDDAIRLLARREYSQAELWQRLTARGHEADDIQACLAALVEQGLQSDSRFAESFVRSRVFRGQGPRRIRADLGQRGIDRPMISEALEAAEGEVDWFELASEVLARRFAGPGETPKDRARRERFLAGRGFDFDHLRHAMSHAWDDD